MKKIIPMLLLAALLSGCGLTEQLDAVNEKYIAPAVEAANNGETIAEAGVSGRRVKTNRASYAGFEPVRAIGARAAEGALTEFTPDDGYDGILPYIGAVYEGEDGRDAFKFGLVTENSRVVLDPVLTSVEFAAYKGESLGALIVGRYVDGGTKYAIIGESGAWATEFIFTEVLATELGVLGIVDLEENHAVCYDANGNVVYDTSTFKAIKELAPGSVGSFAEGGEGYMKICYSNGQFGFIDRNGVILNRAGAYASYFEDLRPYSDGYALVKQNGVWNYIDNKGEYAIYGGFTEAGDFHDGLAVVRTDAGLSVIDKENAEVMKLEGAASAQSFPGYIQADYEDGSTKFFLTPSMNEADIYGKELHMCPEGYWVEGADGVRMRDYEGGELYFAGAVELIESTGDGFYNVRLADGTCAIVDELSRVTLNAAELRVLKDRVTGEEYVGDAAGNVYTTAGALLLATGVPWGDPVDGAFPVADYNSSGWKTADGEWVMRTLLDRGD